MSHDSTTDSGVAPSEVTGAVRAAGEVLASIDGRMPHLLGATGLAVLTRQVLAVLQLAETATVQLTGPRSAGEWCMNRPRRPQLNG